MHDTVLGLGDSITEGPGDSALGVLPRPWAWWLALALDAPYHALAQPGATAREVLDRLAPRAAGRRYGLACVGVGTNDVRLDPFDPEAFGATLGTLVGGLDAARVALPTLPLDLGRPRAGTAKVGAANAAIREVAARHGAVVVDLDDLRGWREVMPDAVHPTAVGQVAIADRAHRALGLDAPLPSALAAPHRSPRAVGWYALTRHLPMAGREVRKRMREGTLGLP
jgi:lysophospholipase L1-like esterase